MTLEKKKENLEMLITIYLKNESMNSDLVAHEGFHKSFFQQFFWVDKILLSRQFFGNSNLANIYRFYNQVHSLIHMQGA